MGFQNPLPSYNDTTRILLAKIGQLIGTVSSQLVTIITNTGAGGATPAAYEGTIAATGVAQPLVPTTLLVKNGFVVNKSGQSPMTIYYPGATNGTPMQSGAGSFNIPAPGLDLNLLTVTGTIGNKYTVNYGV